MEQELEQFFSEDDIILNRDDLTSWDIASDAIAVIFAFAGLLADIAIVYMIARNKRMRIKTNILLMNFAINDALCIISNLRFLTSLTQLIGSDQHYGPGVRCVMQFMDLIFHFNQGIIIQILISNILIKSKRVTIPRILSFVYIFMIINLIVNQIYCKHQVMLYIVFLSAGLFLINIGVVLYKEANRCYRKYYKNDPLTGRTLFRLNIGSIYLASWLFSFIMYIAVHNFVGNMIAHQCFMTSVYILAYIVCADKSFKICFLNMLKCKGAGDYDVNATITFAEDSCDDGQNQVNINMDESNTRLPVQ